MIYLRGQKRNRMYSAEFTPGVEGVSVDSAHFEKHSNMDLQS